MITCLIIDDEPLACDVMGTYISRISTLDLKGTFHSALNALPMINGGGIDLLFLDVNMPDILGTTFYKSLTVRPEVIFTSAYSEYALSGFEMNALDYLLKPITFERFVAATNKASEFMDFKHSKNYRGKDYFFINSSHKIYKIFYHDIIYLEGLKDYTRIHLSGGSPPIMILQNLKYFEDFLPASHFTRIHRSFIVAIDKLTTLTRRMVTIGSTEIPVSDNYRDKLFNIIELVK